MRDRDLRVRVSTLGADIRRLIMLPGTGRVHICPIVGFAAEFGPRYELLAPDDNTTRTAWAAGVHGVVSIYRSGAFHMSATGGYRVWRLTSRYDHLGTRLFTISDVYGTLAGGLRVTYRQWLTIMPEIGTVHGVVAPDQGRDFAAPFGHENAETSISLSLAVAPGRRVARH